MSRRHLRHRNIIDFIGATWAGSTAYIFTAWASGGSLHRMLRQFGPMRDSVLRRYARQLLLAPEYMHHKGVAHRDIKPGNVLVDSNGVVKVADFGVSQHLLGKTGIKQVRVAVTTGA